MEKDIHIKKVSYSIYLDGTLLDNEKDMRLVGLSVSNRINKIPRARLELNYFSVTSKEDIKKAGDQGKVKLTPSTKLKPAEPAKKVAFEAGMEVRIELGYQDENEEVFKGYITKKTIEASNARSFMINIECKHAANQMTLGKRTRFLHEDESSVVSDEPNGTDTVNDYDALSAIVEEYGFKLKSTTGKAQGFFHENLVQYNCSDWDFLIIRAEQMGLVCHVEDDNIHLIEPKWDNPVKAEIKLGEELISYEAEYDETVISPNVYANRGELDEQFKIDIVKEEAKGLNEEAENIQSDTILNHGGDLETDEMQAWVENQLNRQKLAKVRGVAKISGTTQFDLGDITQMVGFDEIWSEKLFIGGIKHVLKNSVWFSYVQAGLSHIPHAEEYQLSTNPDQGLVPPSNGLLFGKVKDYKKGRDGNELVEVAIPTFNKVAASGDSAESQIVYARLATMMAGKDRGSVFRPVKGDEVVVGFINNDPRFPVILGSLFNKTHEPKIELNEDFEQKEVGFFIDKWQIKVSEEKQTLSLLSPDEQSIIIEDNCHITMQYDKDNVVTIDANGVTIDAVAITLKSAGDIVIEGTKIEGKASGEMKLEGAQVAIKGKTSAKVEGPIVQIN